MHTDTDFQRNTQYDFNPIPVLVQISSNKKDILLCKTKI